MKKERLEEIYQKAVTIYQNDYKKYKLCFKPKKYESELDRHREDLNMLMYLTTLFKELTHRCNYNMATFQFANIALTYVPRDRNKAFELMIKKRHDYGITPILITGQIGILVRIISKICRLTNLFDKQEKFESIEDNRLDIFNYAIIGLQLIFGDFNEH